jgi:hypothetical protein
MDSLTAERYGIRTPADWRRLRAEGRAPSPQAPLPARLTPADLTAGQALLADVERASRGRARELRGER